MPSRRTFEIKSISTCVDAAAVALGQIRPALTATATHPNNTPTEPMLARADRDETLL